MSEDEKLHEIYRLVVRIDDKVSDLRGAVFGNGRPGLTDRMTVLEQCHGALKQSHEDCPAREAISGASMRQDRANKMSLFAVIVSSLTAFATIITSFFKQ